MYNIKASLLIVDVIYKNTIIWEDHVLSGIKVSPCIGHSWLKPSYCIVHVYVVIRFRGRVWSFWVDSNLCRLFYCLSIVSLEIPLSWGDGIDLINRLNPVTICTCPKPWLVFPSPYIIVVFRVQWLEIRGDSWIVDHHCFVILFIISFIKLPSGADNDIVVLIRVWKAIGSIRGWVKLKIKTLLFPLCPLITRHYNDKEWRISQYNVSRRSDIFTYGEMFEWPCSACCNKKVSSSIIS